MIDISKQLQDLEDLKVGLHFKIDLWPWLIGCEMNHKQLKNVKETMDAVGWDPFEFDYMERGSVNPSISQPMWPNKWGCEIYSGEELQKIIKNLKR